MQKFEDNFLNFEDQFTKVKESRVAEYRANVHREFEEFFSMVHQAVEKMKEQKRGEIEEIFKKLKIDDMSDLNKY